MKKILFVSNITNRITNFSLPSIIASQELGYEFHLAANCSGFRDDATKYNIKVHHIDFVRNPLNPQNIKAYRQLLALIKDERYDVIHCNTPVGGLIGRICGKKANVKKIIYTVHGFHFYKGAPLVNRTILKWAEKIMAHWTDVIITINKEDFQAAQKLKLQKRGNVYYIPGVGVNTSEISLAKSKRKEIIEEIGGDSNSTLIISVGELNRNKNNEVIVNALGKLQDKNIHFILCGVGDKKAEIFEIAKKNNIQDNIHFLGYRSDIPQLLKSSDVFVLPSYREGLSRSLMEAMSAGIPCIVSEIRGNVDLIEAGKGGYLCQPEDIDDFAKAINDLTIDSKLRKNMSEYNLSKIRQFDIENIKLEIKKIFEKELL